MATNPNDITAYRNKKKRKALLYKVLAVTLVTFGVMIIWLNAEVIFEPLRGIGSRITTKTTADVGFPVKLPGSAGYSLEAFGSYFSLLTDTYLYTYTKEGGQVYALQHGYSNPVQRATDRRVLIYNHDLHEFSMYNKQSRLFEVKLDEKIVYAALGDNDNAAVVTTSQLYSNILYIYGGNGKWKYTRRFGDEKINSVIFVSGSDEVYIATANVTGGDITSHVYRVNYANENDVVWKYSLPPGSLVLGVYETAASVIALCDNMFVSIMPDGTYGGGYSFNEGTLKRPVIGKNFSVLILSDYVTGTTSMNTFDNFGGLISSKEMLTDIKKVVISGDLVYTLEGGVLNTCNRFLENTNSLTLDEEFDNFIKIDNQILLLGYEEVVSAMLS